MNIGNIVTGAAQGLKEGIGTVDAIDNLWAKREERDRQARLAPIQESMLKNQRDVSDLQLRSSLRTEENATREIDPTKSPGFQDLPEPFKKKIMAQFDPYRGPDGKLTQAGVDAAQKAMSQSQEMMAMRQKIMQNAAAASIIELNKKLQTEQEGTPEHAEIKRQILAIGKDYLDPHAQIAKTIEEEKVKEFIAGASETERKQLEPYRGSSLADVAKALQNIRTNATHLEAAKTKARPEIRPKIADNNEIDKNLRTMYLNDRVIGPVLGPKFHRNSLTNPQGGIPINFNTSLDQHQKEAFVEISNRAKEIFADGGGAVNHAQAVAKSVQEYQNTHSSGAIATNLGNKPTGGNKPQLTPEQKEIIKRIEGVANVKVNANTGDIVVSDNKGNVLKTLQPNKSSYDIDTDYFER